MRHSFYIIYEILMELCKGGNLRSFIDKNMRDLTLIDENILINIIGQICIVIKEIHDKNLIHRDLSPDNIFIDENMIIKIGDFGLSKQFDSYNSYAITPEKFGIDYYIAPEILKKGIYSQKSDIWSLGCIIHELLTLNIYYYDKSLNDIKKLILICIMINGKN